MSVNLDVTYYFYNANLNNQYGGGASVPALLAELPLSGVSFSQHLNGAGPLNATLNTRDPKVRRLGVWAATLPTQTYMIADSNGTILWGGIIWTRRYDSSTGQLTLGGAEAFSYFSQRYQAADYTVPPATQVFWWSNPASAAAIAARTIYDACGVPQSLFPGWNNGQAYGGSIVVTGTNGGPMDLSPSLPISQRQSIDSIVSTLAQTGYGVGFDYVVTWTWSNGPGSVPIPTLNLANPRIGRSVATSGLVIDTATADHYEWVEDGTQMATTIYATGSGSGQATASQSDTSSGGPYGSGFPLLETTKSYANLTDATTINYAAQDDLATLEWPVPTPRISIVALSEEPKYGEFLLGDDVRVVVPPDDRFPAGVDTTMRATALDFQIADDGPSLVSVHLNMPPALSPTAKPPM